jgi:hypothetical protein
VVTSRCACVEGGREGEKGKGKEGTGRVSVWTDVSNAVGYIKRDQESYEGLQALSN